MHLFSRQNDSLAFGDHPAFDMPRKLQKQGTEVGVTSALAARVIRCYTVLVALESIVGRANRGSIPTGRGPWAWGVH
jgi:hypothetical protein